MPYRSATVPFFKQEIFILLLLFALQRDTEEARFELAVDDNAHYGLAVRRLKPLGHSSRRVGALLRKQTQNWPAPVCPAGIEPAISTAQRWRHPSWLRTEMQCVLSYSHKHRCLYLRVPAEGLEPPASTFKAWRSTFNLHRKETGLVLCARIELALCP